MKRIFIHMHYMEMGGAERALLGLLNALDTTRVQVDLFLNQHTGDFMPLIPDKVNLLPEQRGYNAIERPLKTIIGEGQWSIAWARLKARWRHRKYSRTLTQEQRANDASIFQYVAEAVVPHLPAINNLPDVPYDLAISFITPHNIVLNQVKARKKIAWIHTDYSTVHVNAERELPIWGGYDRIVSISPDCTRAFLRTFPSLAPKIMEMENILSSTLIRQQAEAFDVSQEMPRNGQKGVDSRQKSSDDQSAGGSTPINLLSVGRFCHAKNYDNVPHITRRIVERGVDVRWYLIGMGDDSLIRQRIAETGMQEHVIIMGPRANPYPYIKACDIYVQPSRYEGKSVTVREAQILGKPVIVTAYPTAASQIKHGEDGLIVPLDNEGCAQGIAQAIAQPEQLRQLIRNVGASDFGNESEVQKIYSLL